MELFKLQFIGFFATVFCLVALRNSSALTLNERIPQTPFINAVMLRRKPKTYVEPPIIARRNKFRRLIYLKHLLQLNCLSEICRQMHSKPPLKRKHESVSKKMSTIRNNSSKHYNQSLLLSRGQKQISDHLHRSRYPAKDRVILLPFNYFMNQPTPQRNFSFPGGLRGKGQPTNQQKKTVIYLREPSRSGGSRTSGEKLIIQNKNVFTNNDEITKKATPPYDKIKSTKGFNVTKPTTATSYSFRVEANPNSLPQYEVREIIEENETNNYLNFKNSTTAKPVTEISKENSNKTVTTPKPKNEINFTATTHEFTITTTHRSRGFFEKTGKVLPQINHEELKKKLRVRPSQSSNNWKSTASPRKTDTDSENLKETVENPMDSFIIDYFGQVDLYNDLEGKTTTVQKYDSDGLVPYTTKRLITDMTTQQTAATTSNPQPISVSPTETQTVQTTLKQYFTTKPTTSSPERSTNTGNYYLKTTTPSVVAETVEEEGFTETINEADLTTPNFEEYLDHPLVFDLLNTIITDSKKDHEKNSRKMHFGQESQKTTKPTLFNELSDPDEVEQRRSDILIDDNFDDYIDEEYQLSALKYLEKLKQNGGNLTIGSIVPLIPEIINDLRADKMSDDDMAILSDAFGKYWKTVLHFANNTNMDMLPLLKMKDEKDLKNVLQNLALEKFLTTTTEKIGSEINTHFNFDMYDYMERYDDLFKEIQERKDHSINSMKMRN